MKTMALPTIAMLRDAFALRSEIGLLYDRRNGLEHRLNETALEFAKAVFTENEHDFAIRSVAELFDVQTAVLESDYLKFWENLFYIDARTIDVRKSGVPEYLSETRLKFPLAIEIELTKVCNWHCDFCYNVWKIPDSQGRRSKSIGETSNPNYHINVDLLKRVLQEAKSESCLRIRYSGGEPTLHPDFEEIIKMTHELGFDVEVFTNGSRVDARMANFLATHGVRVVLLSIHGLEATHKDLTKNSQAYMHAINAARRLIDVGITVVVEALVCEHNESEMPLLAETLSSLGVRHVSFMPYVPASASDPRGPVSLRQVRDTVQLSRDAVQGALDIRVPCAPRHCLEVDPKPIAFPVDRSFDNHCGAGTAWMSISFDGQLRHCPHSKVYAGHAYDGVADTWQKRIVPAVESAIKPTNSACNQCKQFTACRGGCHLDRIKSYDRFPIMGEYHE